MKKDIGFPLQYFQYIVCIIQMKTNVKHIKNIENDKFYGAGDRHFSKVEEK